MLFDPNTLGEREGATERTSIPVPFLGQQVGLGAAIARLTSAVGIQPCGGCKKRAEELDRRFVFRPWDE